ncbi:uncharacterized protein XM38_014360 [Halomicronema hongdechloris C2206]|uniref:Glycosyltransferase family 1 protein n=1 Tax=Halomicronema hongdechloris C2206 TaxID=1641165 RepID=A0A1Z3HK85_9CYAN|nr:hypothetical protein [Halomicronema hongdechloris]ASC70497.1 uncharacterized protein XM38_014360 [Halomicronema hongdechloris C2206]
MTFPPIYFYVPETSLIENLPEKVNLFWPWLNGKIKNASAGTGAYTWTLQTYLNLNKIGFPCKLASTLPEVGVLISHRSLLPSNLKPGKQLLLICLQGDKIRHPFAQIHVVQNPRQTTHRHPFLSCWRDYFIPFWTQSGLVPRNPARGDLFQNIAFFGRDRTNLAPELRQHQWLQKVNELGLNFKIVNQPELWCNYSMIDAVLAVRNFRRRTLYPWKPASKLYNAWLAGVPAILGPESAYRAERKSELDYLEVTSIDETIGAITRLRDDLELRQRMIENANFRAQGIKHEKITQHWCEFLSKVVPAAYQEWHGFSRIEQLRLLSISRMAFEYYKINRSLALSKLRINRVFEKKFFYGEDIYIHNEYF